MNIGHRLRELREAKGLSQGHIEKGTGLLRCYVSRVECGHTIPTLGTLDKWAMALDVEFYQLFYEGEGKPVAPKVDKSLALRTRDRKLLDLFKQMPDQDKQMFLGLARQVVETRGKKM